MTNLSLIHYYFGEREKAFLVGFGTILRAKGHSKPVSMILIDNSFSWITDFGIEDVPHTIIESGDTENSIIKKILEVLNGLKDTICLIANFDILINNKTISLKNLMRTIHDLDTSNEYIFTSEKYFKEFEEFADYVSHVQEL